MDIFCLRRERGILALADFKTIIESGPEEVSTSRYIISTTISPQEEDEIADKIIPALDKRINYWIQDKHYIVRLFISALVFILLYFFCSLVIKDPLPLIDELLISLTGSAISWFIVAKRDIEAKIAKNARREWHSSIENAELLYSSEIGEIEEYLAVIDRINFKDLIGRIVDNDIPEYNGTYSKPLRAALDSYLHYSKKLERRYISELDCGEYNGQKLIKNLLQDYSTGNLDLYLLAFAMGFRQK